MYISINISPLWVSLIHPKTSPTKLFKIQNQQRSLNSSGLNEQSNLFYFYIFYILHLYFQRNDKANCSRTVLAFCCIGTSTVSYWWLISDVSSPFLSQTRYCGGRCCFFLTADSFLFFTWSHLNHSHPAEKKITSSHKRICVNAQQNIKL